MTHEERTAFRNKLEHKASRLMDRLDKACSDAIQITWQEMVWASKIMKDLASVEKDLAKVYHYESQDPFHEDKKY